MEDNKLGKSNDGVVFEFRPEDSTVVWKEIPGYSLYLVSNTGLVVRKYNPERVLHLTRHKTTKGSYLATSVIGDESPSMSVGVHRLVALAFYGPPDVSLGDTPEVNHLDGNKHNNCKYNLEWTNRSLNLFHAVEEGLRYDTIRVVVTDHEEETEKLFHAVSAVARHFSTTPQDMMKVISLHTDKLYRGRYTFTKDSEGFDGKIKHNTIYFKMLDYRTGVVSVLDSCATAMDLSKVFRGTVLWRLRNNHNGIVNGYAFAMASDERPFPKYTAAEITESIEDYQSRPAARAKRYGVTGKNYITGEVVEFKGIKQAGEALGFPFGTIRYLLNGENVKLYRGWFFQYSQELTVWPNFNKDYAEISLRIKKPEFPPIHVTDLKTDTTKLYASFKEFADQNGVWATNASSHFKKKPDLPYQGRWKFKLFDLTQLIIPECSPSQ